MWRSFVKSSDAPRERVAGVFKDERDALDAALAYLGTTNFGKLLQLRGSLTFKRARSYLSAELVVGEWVSIDDGDEFPVDCDDDNSVVFTLKKRDVKVLGCFCSDTHRFIENKTDEVYTLRQVKAFFVLPQD